MKSIKVFAPATVSNVGPGFDIMGFALHEPGDEVVARVRRKKGISIKKISGDNGKLPTSIFKNTATVAILSMVKEKKIQQGIEIEIHKKMGIGSGLGSSAASAVAGVYAVNKLLELGIPKIELLRFALEGERAASGAYHADNVAPCLYGGFTLIRDYNPVDVIKLSYPKNLYCAVVYPHLIINTKDARKLLSKNIPIKNAVAQAGNASALVAALGSGDFDLISRSMCDYIAEPKRAKLIIGYEKVRNAAFGNCAINCNISGSGPSMFSFVRNEHSANKVATAMAAIFNSANIKTDCFVSKINASGPKVID